MGLELLKTYLNCFRNAMTCPALLMLENLMISPDRECSSAKSVINLAGGRIREPNPGEGNRPERKKSRKVVQTTMASEVKQRPGN